MHNYESVLMRHFCKGFKLFINRKSLDDFNLVCDYFSKDSALNERYWNCLKRFCQALVRNNNYGTILEFMHGVFVYNKSFDLERFKDVLSEIKIADGADYSLKDLCVDYYNNYLKLYYGLFDIENSGELVDPFRLDGNLNKKNDRCIYGAVLVTISEKIYNKRINLDTILFEDVDNWAIESEASLPNVLFPFIRYTSYRHKWDIFNYTLEKYVLPSYIKINWSNRFDTDNCIHMMLIDTYIDYINESMSRLYYPPECFNTEDFLWSINKYAEFEDTSGVFKLRCDLHNDYGIFSLRMAELFERIKPYKEVLTRDCDYSDLCKKTIYMLYLSGNKSQTIQFLINNFNELSDRDKTDYIIQVILIKCINACEEIDDACTLYGYYIYGSERSRREYHIRLHDIRMMIAFLKKIKEQIKNNDEFERSVGKTYYEIIYGDGVIDEIVSSSEELIKKDYSEADTAVFIKLYNTVVGFNRLDYTKKILVNNTITEVELWGAYDITVVDEAKGYETDKFRNAFFNFLVGINLYKLRRTVLLKLNNHLDSLVERKIVDSLKEISMIRTGIPEDISDEQKECYITEIEYAVERLRKKLIFSDAARTEYERRIYEYHNAFLSKNGMQDRNLFAALPMDIQNIVLNNCITSELVFDTLSNMKNMDALDYTAAVVSLVKSIERVLGYAFSRMNIKYYEGLSDDIATTFFKNNKVKKHLEFGPYIYMLQDYDNISTSPKESECKRSSDRYLILKNKYVKPHFNEWGGDKVFDISELSRFVDIDFPVDWVNGEETYFEKMTLDDQDYNRHIFAASLRYIKNKFRNPLLHVEKANKEKASECREFILKTQNILWVLLAIIIPEDN